MQCCPDAGLGNPCDAGAGNPLNVMNGNKYQREVDMPALPGVLGLELVRHYNSDDARPYILQTDTRYAATAALQAEQATQTAWVLKDGKADPSSKLALPGTSKQFDALGRITQSTDTAGRIVKTRYDLAGRVVGTSDAQGNRSESTLDTEGHTQVAGLYRPGSDKPYRAAYSWHDGLGRLTQRLLPDGRVQTWTHAEAGHLGQYTDGDDIRTTYLEAGTISQSPDGWVRASIHAHSGLTVTPQNASQATVLHDDFGRTVQQLLPDHGLQTANYDTAHRLTRLTAADASSVNYHYDTAGRLLQKTYLDADGACDRQGARDPLSL